MRTKLTLTLIFSALIIIFILQNLVIVEIQLFFWTISLSRSLFMFLLLAIGFIIGWFLKSYLMHQKNKKKA